MIALPKTPSLSDLGVENRRVPGQPVDRTAAHRQARLRARLGAPVKAFLEPELRRRLDHYAAARQMTIADVLREALASYLVNNPLPVRNKSRRGSPRSEA